MVSPKGGPLPLCFSFVIDYIRKITELACQLVSGPRYFYMQTTRCRDRIPPDPKDGTEAAGRSWKRLEVIMRPTPPAGPALTLILNLEILSQFEI